MIIKKIHLKNIRSYEDEEILFPEGSVVLAGDIGSGKTSILLSIEFALFGLQPGQKGSSLLRNGKEEGFVSLEIEIDGKKIVIERGLKKGKTISQTESKIELESQSTDLSVTELKNKVLSILNYPKEFAKKTNLLYRFTVYTPQEEMKQIILEAPETRLDTLRHIFGIDKYKRIKENTETFITNLREQIRNYEGQIKDLELINKKLEEKKNAIILLESNLAILGDELILRIEERKKAELEIKEVEKNIKEKEKFERELEKTRIMILGKNEEISRIESEKNSIIRQVEEARKLKFDPVQIAEIEERIRNKEKETEEKNKLYIEILSKHRSLLSKMSEYEKLKSQISILDLCPTCLQNVPEDYKKNVARKFQEEIDRCKKETDSLSAERNIILSSIDNLKKEAIAFKRNLDELKILKVKLENIAEKESRILELEKQKNNSEKDKKILDEQILTLRESISLFKKYDAIFEVKNSELRELLRKEKEKEIELASSKREKEITLKIIEEIKAEIKTKEDIKLKLLKLTELEDWLSSAFLSVVSFTEKNIMLKLREDFSKLFNDWFNILVPENFSVRLDEDFTPVIEQQEYQIDYSFMSGGERTAIALAYRLALNQVINSLMSRIKTKDLIILDEPTDGFSEQQLDKMRDVLHQLNVHQLIIVSHEPKIESFVQNIIRFKKESGITKVEK
ncbi:AAA family ATPase [Candidatus Pacearchaeota archaeon]|nr:AAA family ATPase [Candidatus Pacearchaeota archaeon]